MSIGVRQHCRLFLEGREVPFISGSAVCNENQSIMASFDLVPLQVIKFVRPRTQVHLFVRDDRAFGDNNYYLAIEGEVVGRGFGKSAQGNRYMRISVVDYSQYWDETMAYFYNANFVAGKVEEIANDPGTETLENAIKSQGAAKLISNSTINSTMIQKLLDASNKDLIEGVTKVLRELSEVNLYYKTAYDRLRIADRIIIRSSGKVKEFLQEFQLEEFLLQYTGAQGGSISLRQILNSILGLVFHQHISAPFPPYLDVKDATGKSTGKKAIANFLFVPDAYSLPPPKCNVIFPNQLSDYAFSEDFRASPTRLSFRYSLMNFTGPNQEAKVQSYPIKYYPPSFSDYMYGTKNAVPNPKNPALLDASSLFKDASGRTFASVNYGKKKATAVGDTSLSPILREADFQTNDESLRGIFLDTMTFAPAVSALAKHGTEIAQSRYFGSIGEYSFFKRRFAARGPVPAKLLFHPFLVPGFNCVIVDDSDAGQTVIAKLQTVVHQFSNDGCATSVTLAYARDFDEVDALSGGSGDPPPPAWFDTSVFGVKTSTTSVDPAVKKETSYLKKQGALSSDETASRETLTGATIFPKISEVFQQLLGCDAITDFGTAKSELITTRGAAAYLSKRYRTKSQSDEGRDIFVRNYQKRPIPKMSEAMSFLGARAQGGVIPEEFATFRSQTTGDRANRFDGKGFPDENILKVRRAIIDKYIAQLRTQRGFRG